MKIVSWNVNSVRARIENILQYIKNSSPDILFLQEIKTQNESFPSETFAENGYNSYVFGQKSYNGVAFLSKSKIENVKTDFIKDKLQQSRIITGEILIGKKKFLIPLPLPMAKLIAFFLEKIPKPLLTIDQLKLLKYDNILSGKTKSNIDIGFYPKLKFTDEVKKYSYMWKEGGEYSK